MPPLAERAPSVNRASAGGPIALLALIFIGLLWLHRPALGQGQAPPPPGMRLTITGVNRSRFPEMGVNLIATDGQSQPLNNFNRLRFWENGVPIADYELRDVTVGVDLFFVLDGSARLLEIEDEAGLVRMQLVKDTIQFYSGRFMDVAGRDRVSIVVPNGEGGEALVQGVSQPGELIDAINRYNPRQVAGDGAIDMVDTTLSLAQSNNSRGRFQAIVLFTDGIQLNPLLTEGVVARARQLEVPIFVLLLGPSESENAVERITSLTTPTRGRHAFIRGTSESSELFQVVLDNATQTQLVYQTNLSQSGNYPLNVSLDGVQDEMIIELRIEPPEVEISLEGGAIRRSGIQPDTELTALQPAVQPVPVIVTWPDEMPRRLTSMSLLVDGEPQDAPVIGSSQNLQFDWDIRDLEEGSYTLSVEVTDSLGLTAESAPVDVTIQIVRPQPLPTPTATPTPTPLEVIGRIVPVESLPQVTTGPLLGMAVLVVLLLVLMTRQLSGGEPQQRSDKLSSDNKPLERPAAPVTGGALLQPVEQALTPFSIVGDNVTLGRDADYADVAIDDPTVSLLHARIRRQNGAYWLYDEGSEHGTQLNFERLGLAPRQLGDGDEVQLGRVRLRFFVVDDFGIDLDSEE